MYWLPLVSERHFCRRSLSSRRFCCPQVSDSGRPPLQSSCHIDVRVIQESVYPPVVLPLDVFIAAPGEEYAGGVLGKVHATDQDVYDTLTYGLVSSASSASLFSISASDGRLVAGRPLDPGRYHLNVSVTDGRFTATAGVSVHMRHVSPQTLERSLTLRIAGVTPEEFVTDYWRNFQRALRNVAGVRRDDVQLLSLQPVAPPSDSDLDVLLSLERPSAPSTPHDTLFRKLNGSLAAVEEVTGVRVVRIFRKLCAGLDCPLRFCQETISLDGAAMSTYSTARLSFITPRHHRTPTCLCQGTSGPGWALR